MSSLSRKDILITVKTYPNPSRSYEETVCTAGISKTGKWVRLYPINYRRLDKQNQFEKYQWISLDVSKRTNDIRPESYKPKLETIQVGEKLDTKYKWKKRQSIIEKLPVRTVKECKAQYELDKTSLSIVQPKEILDFVFEKNNDDWKPEFKSKFEQFDLFGDRELRLQKLPYKFYYVYTCEDEKKPRKTFIEDWELGAQFLKLRKSKESEEVALRKIKQNFLGRLCSQERDTKFFMGTFYPYNTWLILGVYWPPKPDPQQDMFDL